METPENFIHRLKNQNHILNKQYHVKVLLKRFHLNGNTIGLVVQRLKSMVLFIQYVVLTFVSVDVILWCYHSNETSSVVLSQGTICFTAFCLMMLRHFGKKSICEENHTSLFEDNIYLVIYLYIYAHQLTLLLRAWVMEFRILQLYILVTK